MGIPDLPCIHLGSHGTAPLLPGWPQGGSEQGTACPGDKLPVRSQSLRRAGQPGHFPLCLPGPAAHPAQLCEPLPAHIPGSCPIAPSSSSPPWVQQTTQQRCPQHPGVLRGRVASRTAGLRGLWQQPCSRQQKHRALGQLLHLFIQEGEVRSWQQVQQSPAGDSGKGHRGAEPGLHQVWRTHGPGVGPFSCREAGQTDKPLEWGKAV